MNCAFCDIIRADLRGQIVDKTPSTITIEPLHPVTRGHLLVIPWEHYEYIHQMQPDALFGLIVDVKLVAADAHPCNIIQSNGKEATQTVPHVHFHIVPRRENDGLKLPWGSLHG